MKRRAIAILDWVVRLFVNDPPHPLPPPRWMIVTRDDGAKVFRDRYGDNIDIEIITSELVPPGKIYLINQSYIDALGKEIYSPNPVLPDSPVEFLSRPPGVKLPTKLIITSS